MKTLVSVAIIYLCWADHGICFTYPQNVLHPTGSRQFLISRTHRCEESTAVLTTRRNDPWPRRRRFDERAAAGLRAEGRRNGKISQERRKQLGIADDEDEYDLDVALSTNTDPLISKIIAGSLIVVLLGLLVVGVVIPSLTDYGDFVCNPIRTGGRC
jgi:hypothetical protein